MAAKRMIKKTAAPEQNRSAAAQRAAESDGDFSHYLDKEPTDLQARFIDWLQGDSVGFDPTAAKTKADAFSEGVRLGVALRMRFQASPENQEVLEEQRAKREAGGDEDEAPKPKRAAKKAAAPAKRTKTRAQEAEEEEPEDSDDDLEPEEDLEEPEEAEEAAEEEPEPAPKPKRARASRTSSAAAGGSSTAKRPARRTRASAKSTAAPF